MSALTHAGEFVDVPGVADHPARRESREILARIIEARLEELFGMVQDAIDESERRRFVTRGIVLTGGTAQLNGIVELAAHVFQMPVRVGVPTYTGPLQESLRNTRYATAYGLLLEGQKQSQRHSLLIERTSPRGLFWQKLKAWFVGNF
jgi:cell division protein FtsA